MTTRRELQTLISNFGLKLKNKLLKEKIEKKIILVPHLFIMLHQNFTCKTYIWNQIYTILIAD